LFLIKATIRAANKKEKHKNPACVLTVVVQDAIEDRKMQKRRATN
jgi:hypothetical protein